MPSDDTAPPPEKPRLALVTPPPGPPSSEKSASAPSEGKGAGKKPPREKLINWGIYSHLLENFALIYSTDTVWDASTRLIMKISAMAHAHGADYVRMWKVAESSHRRLSGKRWTVMPTDVVFDPEHKCDPETSVNLFGGLKMEPKEGNVEPMLKLVRHLTSRASEHASESDQVMHWLLCWFAYPLQHIGAKLRTAVIMHGDEGAGKNFLFDTQVMIFGEYGATVGQDELEDKFNDWRSRKLFVVGDEVSSRQELVHNKNRLKSLITSTTVQINPKNLPRREEANHINIAFLSNELQPLALDNTDRRYLVIFTPQALEIEFYRELGEWRRNGGVQAWFDYLLKYPLDDFDPYAPAPVTRAKDNLIELNRKSPEQFWLDWHGDLLSLPYRTCSVDQAYRAYEKYCLRMGDKYPLKKPVFSAMATRMSESMKHPARIKSMKPTMPDGAMRTVRMFLVTEPLLAPEQGEGAWATECIADFEKPLRTYLHGPRSPDDKEPDGEQT